MPSDDLERLALKSLDRDSGLESFLPEPRARHHDLFPEALVELQVRRGGDSLAVHDLHGQRGVHVAIRRDREGLLRRGHVGDLKLPLGVGRGCQLSAHHLDAGLGKGLLPIDIHRPPDDSSWRCLGCGSEKH